MNNKLNLLKAIKKLLTQQFLHQNLPKLMIQGPSYYNISFTQWVKELSTITVYNRHRGWLITNNSPPTNEGTSESYKFIGQRMGIATNDQFMLVIYSHISQNITYIFESTTEKVLLLQRTHFNAVPCRCTIY